LWFWPQKRDVGGLCLIHQRRYHHAAHDRAWCYWMHDERVIIAAMYVCSRNHTFSADQAARLPVFREPISSYTLHSRLRTYVLTRPHAFLFTAYFTLCPYGRSTRSTSPIHASATHPRASAPFTVDWSCTPRPHIFAIVPTWSVHHHYQRRSPLGIASCHSEFDVR